MRGYEQISESTYLKDVEYWKDWSFNNGLLEICDDNTGKPMYIIGVEK